jgi:hypothetical protein
MWRTSAACPVDSNCVFDGINFISLRRSDYYEVEAEDGQKFLLNVCGPVRSDLCNASGSVTACEVDKNNSVTVIGWLHGYHMQRLQQKGVVLTYRNSSKGEHYVQGVMQGKFRLYNDCAMCWMIQGSNPIRDKRLFRLENIHASSEAH